ncbi:hypothetical protein L6452_43059 [Arctium lappa]|uniref:Uncharacterized protein n=1 Tax=Arctium lappa TaxID=4217 RepID=A0ACB8XK02_ARCLA|nr:hypothetical protein L6452_43059 [Arctium lappa]
MDDSSFQMIHRVSLIHNLHRGSPLIDLSFLIDSSLFFCQHTTVIRVLIQSRFHSTPIQMLHTCGHILSRPLKINVSLLSQVTLHFSTRFPPKLNSQRRFKLLCFSTSRSYPYFCSLSVSTSSFTIQASIEAYFRNLVDSSLIKRILCDSHGIAQMNSLTGS